MPLQMIGCSHHDCPVEIRERLAVPRQQILGVLNAFQQRFPQVEAVLLSTCNRTELYTACDNSMSLPTAAETIAFLAADRGMPPDFLGDKLAGRREEGAVRHLFAVAASLDSMVVGETQILAQIKSAYLLASEVASAGERTHRAFQAALRVAKRIARETNIHQHRVSIPSIAVQDFIPRVFERLDDKRILVIGAGEMAEETLRYLVQAGGRRIQVVCRDVAQAGPLTLQFGAQVVPWDGLADRLVEADLVISATGSAEAVVGLDLFRSLESRRRQRPLFVLDLAIPRDFDPRIGDCLGVYLYSMDDLNQTCQENRMRREGEIPQAERIVEEEARLFVAQSRHESIAPTVRRLRETADEIRLAELERLLHRLPNIDADARDEITRTTERIVNKILHPPLETLREGETGLSGKPLSLLDAFKRLFQLREELD